jgi:hypothetical protein
MLDSNGKVWTLVTNYKADLVLLLAWLLNCFVMMSQEFWLKSSHDAINDS